MSYRERWWGRWFWEVNKLSDIKERDDQCNLNDDMYYQKNWNKFILKFERSN